ncbi:mediator of RNA polymerase II transcription subunit 19 [Platysternon megacephalum]|uniref:Mediator of RNA polymerase II transcription subunit 19 n=1 Tax=Platysternon megacephalum TaxID=55544 RepID=A0A4D9DKU5_9SAUR|nr:mediator of RNA polymerase II transcription subunit 19 [Platysternon megacephalum]
MALEYKGQWGALPKQLLTPHGGTVDPKGHQAGDEVGDSLLYPYGPAQGDKQSPKADDGASPEIPISMIFTFYGKEYRSLYVNNNGVVSFGVAVSQYTPDPFPLADGRPFVAPYWGDVNNNLGGDIYYRETQDAELLRRLTRDINQYFPEIPFTATWAFVATWDRVAYFGSTSQKVNTFQAVLANDGKVTFIMLNYGTIQWTTGTASGGDANTGLGGIPAQLTNKRLRAVVTENVCTSG